MNLEETKKTNKNDKFFEIAKEIETAKTKERNKINKFEKQADAEYITYCIWCNGYKNGECKTDSMVFSKYLKYYNKNLSFYTKKYIAEKYFGYKYQYDNEKNKWKIFKKIQKNV